MEKPAILIAEPNKAWRQDLKNLLCGEGFEVVESSDLTGILRTFRQKQNLVLLIINVSLKAPGDGLGLAQQIHRWDRTLPVIVTTTHSSEDLAIAALRAGAADYFKLPLSCEDVVASVRRCLADARVSQSSVRSAVSMDSGPTNLIGESQPMRRVKAYIGKVAATDSNVLVTGETGTGKELVAERIHRSSARQHRPFVCINCAAVPDSLLESELFGYEKGAFTGANTAYEGKLKIADSGTIFFDEIGDMSPYAQAKILRAIESREVQRLGAKKGIPVDVRIIAATNQDVEHLMSEDKFRKDLYFRLNVARVHLPPLRDRKEDIPALFGHCIAECNRRFGRQVEGFTDETLEYLLGYDWPGNVRELKNLIEAIFVNAPARRISFSDLPELFRTSCQETAALPADERAQLLATLSATNWNKSQAAQKLHWSRVTLYRKMWRYGIVSKGEAKKGQAKISDIALFHPPRR